MFQKVLLAAALQHWDVPSPYASAAREVATQLAKGSAHPLSVLTVYTYPVLPLVPPPLVGPELVEEIGADGLVIGAHSKRAVVGLGGTARAICERASAIVVVASPAQ